jgi:hypothetical protein
MAKKQITNKAAKKMAKEADKGIKKIPAAQAKLPPFVKFRPFSK